MICESRLRDEEWPDETREFSIGDVSTLKSSGTIEGEWLKFKFGGKGSELLVLVDLVRPRVLLAIVRLGIVSELKFFFS